MRCTARVTRPGPVLILITWRRYRCCASGVAIHTPVIGAAARDVPNVRGDTPFPSLSRHSAEGDFTLLIGTGSTK
jgi:hypothetical protein